MPIDLSSIRDELLPGLLAVRGSYEMAPLAWNFAQIDEIVAANVLNEAFRSMPVVSLPVAFAVGVAAAVINNPVVSRRGLFGG